MRGRVVIFALVLALPVRAQTHDEFVASALKCDDWFAAQFSTDHASSAETIAAAAFEKCRDIWTAADNLRNEHMKAMQPSEAQMKENPFALSTYLSAARADDERNGLPAWKASELARLLPAIIQARAGKAQ